MNVRVSVYVIASEGGMCKVGMARDPRKRMAELATGHPFKLSLAHVAPAQDEATARRFEAAVHQRLVQKQMVGEWFDVGADEAILVVDDVFNPRAQPVRPPQQCSTCLFFRLIPSDHRRGIDQYRGTCRRHSPCAVQDGSNGLVSNEVGGATIEVARKAIWAAVLDTHWCGDYRYDPEDI